MLGIIFSLWFYIYKPILFRYQDKNNLFWLQKLNKLVMIMKMPRGILTKNDLFSKIYKLKTSLYNGDYIEKTEDWHDGAHEALTKILNYMQEYSS